MAEQNLSLIPYAADRREVVLRHGSAVVLYDANSKHISLRRTDEMVDLGPAECPLCRRPLEHIASESASPVDDENELRSPTEAGFMNPGYFRMLHNSRAGSQESSPVTSPQLRLEQLHAGPPSAERRGSSSAQATPHSGPYSHAISPEALSPNYFKTFFVEERELGRGGKGVVLLVRHVIDGVDLGRFALKRVPVGNDSEWLKKVLVEVQLLQSLSHANLVSYRHVWLENYQINPFSPAVPCAFILQQYCNAGDLHQYIFGAARTFTKEQLKSRIRTRSKGQLEIPDDLHSPRRLHFEEIFSFFRDITSGLNYLHRKKYIHRDLKPSNCLLHRTGSQIRVLVSDFGEMQGADAVRKSTGSTGTISFCAPEVLREQSPGVFGNFSEKSDVFSLGLIVYLMCFGRLPYTNSDTAAEENEDIDQLKDEIAAWTGIDVEHRQRSDLPERLYKFLKLLLSLDPSERPGTEEILHSIKAGSAVHEHGQTRTASSPQPRDHDENERVSPSVGMSSNETRRRHSAFVRPSLITAKSSEVESRRPGSPRMLPVETSQPPRTDTMTRRSSLDVGIAKQGFATGQRLLTGPKSRRDKAVEFLGQPGVQSCSKLLLFSFKAWTCLRPCSPVATKAWISYPLLGIAALDVAGLGGNHVVSLASLMLHLCIIWTAAYGQWLCEA